MQRFTGGDDLTGVKKYYHLVMMNNELAGGFGAYQLSFAKRGVSGLSFGGNQLDLAHNKKAQTIFMEIMQSATDDQGRPLFDNSEIIRIATNMKTKGKPPEEVFSTQLLYKINKAFASEVGMTRINQVYVEEIEEKAKFVTGFLPRIDNEFSNDFYKTILGQVLLFDYHNQYNIGYDGKLEQYIDGDPIKTFLGQKLLIENSYNLEHHKDFLYGLKYASDDQANLRDVNRRLDNIISIMCKALFSEIYSKVLVGVCPCANNNCATNCVYLSSISSLRT